MLNRKSLAVSIFVALATFTGATIVMANDVCACDKPKDPPPEPPKPDPEPVKTEKHEGRDRVCPAESTQVSVLKKVGDDLEKDDRVSVRDGDRTVTKRGGDYIVTKRLSARSVCVAMVSTTTTAPVATKRPAKVEERPKCNAEVGYVCPDTYVGGKAD